MANDQGQDKGQGRPPKISSQSPKTPPDKPTPPSTVEWTKGDWRDRPNKKG